jgi:hypothetical protein
MASNNDGRPFPDVEYNHAQWDQVAETVALSTSSAKTAAVYPPGLYLITASADCFIRSGTQAAVVAVAATSNPLWAKTYLLWQVTSADNGGLAGITASGTANLYIMKPSGDQS